MHLGNITSGAAFRLAILLSPIFILVLTATGAFMFNVVESTSYEELHTEIEEELMWFRSIHEQEGLDALTGAINALSNANAPGQRLIGILAPDGSIVAGNIKMAPTFSGWGNIIQDSVLSQKKLTYHGVASQLGDGVIVISRTTRSIAANQTALLKAMLIAGFLIVVFIFSMGFMISRQAGGKLGKISEALEKVSRGDVEARLPIGRSNDQIDRISRQINQHLDRLSTLMETTSNTIVNIAHELRSPLNRAYLSLQQAVDERGNVSTRNVKLALTDLAGLSSVFDTMLRISRIESSTDRSNFASFSGAELLQDITEAYEPVIANTGQKLTYSYLGNTSIPLFGDRKMLIQLLANLIENASRFAPRGTEIQLSFSENKGNPVLEVADSGPGIPASKRDHVLRPFGSLSEDGHLSGNGLGLALVLAIATHHGAKLELLDNEPGLRVRLILPSAPVTPGSGSRFATIG